MSCGLQPAVSARRPPLSAVLAAASQRAPPVSCYYIYRDNSETAYRWEGEVDGNGKVKVDKVGQANPYGRHPR